MSSTPYRNDGPIFSDDYLLSANQGVAESVLWPVPVLHHCAQTTVSIGDVAVTPGDVLELISKQREEYLLVVSLINKPNEAKSESWKSSTDILCFSSNTNTYHLINENSCRAPVTGDILPDQLNADSISTDLLIRGQDIYAIHSDVVDPVDDTPLAAISLVQDSPASGGYEQSRSECYYPYSNPPNPMSPAYPKGTYSVEAEEELTVDDLKDSLFVGDATEQLRRIPDNTYHSFVTSPPYPESQRDYGCDGQIGDESSPSMYLNNLLSVLVQAMRVLREDGTGWVVIDDAIQDGEYIGVPDRLTAQLREEGFRIIHNGPWVKRGCKPDPAPKRFGHHHERVIGIAKSDDYYFNRKAVENDSDVFEAPTSVQSDFDTPDGDVSHDAMFSVELVEQILNASVPNHVCKKCGAPFTPEYEVTDILDLKDNRHKERVLDAFERVPEITREHARACRSLGLGDTGQSKRTQTGTNRNSQRVQELIEEVRDSEFPDSYIREFTYAKKHLTGYTQGCDCEGIELSENTTGGLVLDPFCGTDTTGEAARRNGYHSTGIDLNSEYIELARKRKSSGVDTSLSSFTI